MYSLNKMLQNTEEDLRRLNIHTLFAIINLPNSSSLAVPIDR